MIKLSTNKQNIKDAEKMKAAKLYYSGFSLRDTAEHFKVTKKDGTIKTRSHEWVRSAVMMYLK